MAEEQDQALQIGSKAKDVTERSFVNINKIYANIANAAFFNGEQIVLSDELSDAMPYMPRYEEKNASMTLGDVHKYWKQGGSSVIMCRFMVENETAHRREIGLKVMGYMGYAYYDQLSTGMTQKISKSISQQDQQQKEPDSEVTDKKSNKGTNKIYYYPILAVVLNFGTTKMNSIRLSDCLDYPEGEAGQKLKEAVEQQLNITIPVMNLAYIRPEDAVKQNYHPDLVQLISILWAVRTKNDLPTGGTVEYKDEFMALLKALYERDKETLKEIIPKQTEKEEGNNMTSFFNEYLKLYREKVMEEAMEKAKEELRDEVKEEAKEEVREEVRGEVTEEVRNKTIMEVVMDFIKKNPQIDEKSACEALSVPYQQYLNARAVYAGVVQFLG